MLTLYHRRLTAENINPSLLHTPPLSFIAVPIIGERRAEKNEVEEGTSDLTLIQSQ